MALSNISKEHLENLFISLHQNDNTIDIIKSNYSQYARLKEIAKQIQYLKNEAQDIINEASIQDELHKVKKNFRIVSGNSYYLYQKDNLEKYFSIISPNEWDNKDIFLGKYFYDFDKQFILE